MRRKFQYFSLSSFLYFEIRSCPNNMKAQYLITTALYYLMDGDPVNAETYNNRASEYVKDLGETVEDRLAMLRYMVDSSRRLFDFSLSRISSLL